MARRPRADGPKREPLVDEGLVLRVTPVGEGDGIATLFLRDAGKVRASVKRLRSVRSGFAGRFELLSRIRLAYEPGRDFGRVTEALVLHSSFPVLSRPEISPFGHYLAELADELLPERDPSANAYRLLAKAVLGLEAGIPPRQVARYVEYWMLRLSGHVPDHRACGRCGRKLQGPPAEVREGPPAAEGAWVGPDGILCGACARGAALPGERLAAGALPALAALGKRDLLSLAGEPLSEVELQGAGRFARALMRDLLGRDLRSTVYLRRYHLDSI